jgi:hypothetical protein
LDGLGGVHGYSRNVAVTGSDGSTYVPGPLYYNYLFKAGTIPTKIFSIFIADTSESSFVELGSSDFKSYSTD